MLPTKTALQSRFLSDRTPDSPATCGYSSPGAGVCTSFVELHTFSAGPVLRPVRVPLEADPLLQPRPRKQVCFLLSSSRCNRAKNGNGSVYGVSSETLVVIDTPCSEHFKALAVLSVAFFM